MTNNGPINPADLDSWATLILVPFVGLFLHYLADNWGLTRKWVFPICVAICAPCTMIYFWGFNAQELRTVGDWINALGISIVASFSAAGAYSSFRTATNGEANKPIITENKQALKQEINTLTTEVSDAKDAKDVHDASYHPKGQWR